MQKNCAFRSTAQNFLLVGPYFQRIIFRTQWPLPLTYRLGAVTSLKFLVTENMA